MLIVTLFLAVAGSLGSVSGANAQVDSSPFNNREINTVSIQIVNPSPDAGLNTRIEDAVRRALALFPGARYSRERVALALGKSRRNADIADVTHEPLLSGSGGVDLNVLVTLGNAAENAKGRGFALTGDSGDFPVIYDRNGTYLRFKLDAFALYYGNNNAWYGRPDLMLAGNPLAEANPSGRGYNGWGEAYLHYGIYGITPINENLSFYGGLSAITSHSTGSELFTDRTRSHTAFEDAYIGIVGGNVDAAGNRLSFDLSAGRRRFTLANGFLIAATAANGHDRAALQANARWASDLLVLGKVAYNNTKVEAFYLDPDELPLLDSETKIAGLNFETKLDNGLSLGASYLTVPSSQASYFGPTGTVIGGREGLKVIGARFNYMPNSAGTTGPFFGAEIAQQTNSNFDMKSRAGWAEVGYHFAEAKWSPTISYRLAYFSGDDPATSTYERWDPLLSGGTGEQWVQGINHFKVVQDSNVIAQRIQARFKVSRQVEIVPQLWAFRAASLNNIGGNPALSFLSDRELGYEANVTVKWFKSRNVYVHGHVAYTMPGKAVKSALGGDASGWWSVMLFARYSF